MVSRVKKIINPNCQVPLFHSEYKKKTKKKSIFIWSIMLPQSPQNEIGSEISTVPTDHIVNKDSSREASLVPAFKNKGGEGTRTNH